MRRLPIMISVSLCVLALAACGKKEASEGTATATASANDSTATATATAPGGPSLKAGVWEMTAVVKGLSQGVTTKMCLDESLGAKMTTQMGGMQANDTKCDQTAVTTKGNVTEMTAVCMDGSQKVNTKVRFEMQGDNAYHQTIDATFDPPSAGRDAVSTAINGKWLGPCDAGMKAGDLILPGGMKVNMYDAMKSHGEPKK